MTQEDVKAGEAGTIFPEKRIRSEAELLDNISECKRLLDWLGDFYRKNDTELPIFSDYHGGLVSILRRLRTELAIARGE